MFNKPFHQIVKKQRIELGLSQADSALSCGLTRNRFANLECGHRAPSPLEIERLLERFQLSSRDLQHADPSLSHSVLRKNGKSALPTRYRKYWEAPRDRDAYIRYFAAKRRFPQLVTQLYQKIAVRPDYSLVQAATSRLSLQSLWEALLVLHLLAAGAVPALVMPGQLGWLPLRLVDPVTLETVSHRYQVCLLLGESVYFFQASFAASTVSTVDVLMWRNGWFILEVDGPGHDASDDFARDAEFKLPVLRWTATQVERGEFLGVQR